MSDGVRVGIYSAELSFRRLLKLPKYCITFRTKVFEVRKAAETTYNAGNNINKINIYVYIVYSEAAIEVIISHLVLR